MSSRIWRTSELNSAEPELLFGGQGKEGEGTPAAGGARMAQPGSGAGGLWVRSDPGPVCSVQCLAPHRSLQSIRRLIAPNRKNERTGDSSQWRGNYYPPPIAEMKKPRRQGPPSTFLRGLSGAKPGGLTRDTPALLPVLLPVPFTPGTQPRPPHPHFRIPLRPPASTSGPQRWKPQPGTGGKSARRHMRKQSLGRATAGPGGSGLLFLGLPPNITPQPFPSPRPVVPAQVTSLPRPVPAAGDGRKWL